MRCVCFLILSKCTHYSHGFSQSFCSVILKGRKSAARNLCLRSARDLSDHTSWIPYGNRVRWHVLGVCRQSGSNISCETSLTLVTTAAAPIVHPFPIVTPGKMVTLPPIQQSSSMVISPPNSGPCVPFLTSGSSGCVPEKSETLEAINVLAPIRTLQVSRIVQLKLM